MAGWDSTGSAIKMDESEDIQEEYQKPQEQIISESKKEKKELEVTSEVKTENPQKEDVSKKKNPQPKVSNDEKKKRNQPQEERVAKVKAVPTGDYFAQMGSLAIESGIEESRWKAYKKDLTKKPDELTESTSNKAMLLPEALLDQLNKLAKYNPKIHTKTIVTNLIVDFFERNQDIIQLMEQEYNKNK